MEKAGFRDKLGFRSIARWIQDGASSKDLPRNSPPRVHLVDPSYDVETHMGGRFLA